MALRVGEPPFSPSIWQSIELVLFQRLECGPFDGGCLALALALQRVLGGEIAVIEGRHRNFPLQAATWHPLEAQHAVLHLGPDLYLDAGGYATSSQLLARLPGSLLICGANAVRPYRVGDLPDTVADQETVGTLEIILRRRMEKRPTLVAQFRGF